MKEDFESRDFLMTNRKRKKLIMELLTRVENVFGINLKLNFPNRIFLYFLLS